MNRTVSIVIPAWNLWDMTLRCLESLARHTAPDHLEVIVVDNGSTDATVTDLASAGEALFGPRFIAARLSENQGFARGCNAGARAASGDLLFFLNNDTLATENWLPPLRAAFNAPRTGAAGPLLLTPDSERVQHCGIVFSPTLELTHLHALFPGDHPLARKPRILQALTGAALMLPAALFHKFGGFHEGYINGFEDLDLCCAVRQAGLLSVSVPDSVIYHLASQTPGRFDHDDPNARLLNSRRPGDFAPDLHRLGAEDGFMPALSPALEMYLTLPPDKEAALTTAFVRRFDADRCRAGLLAEPLWQGGYALLAAHLESRGQWAEACAARRLLAHFFPLPEHAAALARTAARARDAALASQAELAVQELLRLAAQVPALRQKAENLARWSRNADEAALADLYENWLARAT